MSREIFWLWIVTSLGSKSPHPRAVAPLRLGCALFVATVTGTITGNMLRPLVFFQGLPKRWIVTFLYLAGYILAGIVMLTLRSGWTHGSHSTINRLLVTLPIRGRDRWLFSILPHLFVSGLLSLFLVPLVVVLADKLAFSVILAIFLLVASLSSVLGLVLWPRLKTSIFLVLLAALTLGLPHLLGFMASHELWRQVTCWLLLLVMIALGIIGWYKSRTQMIRQTKLTRTVRRWPFSTRQWFIVKLLRNGQTWRSWLTSFGLALVLAGVILWRQIAQTNIFGWLLFSAVLALAFATEVRTTSRLHRTPEITAVRDVVYFVKREWWAAIFCGLIVGLPILVSILWATQDTAWIITYVSYQVYAVAIGLVMGTLLGPEQGNIGIQFVTTCLALGLFFAIPKMSGLASRGIAAQNIGRISLALLVLLTTYTIEYRRRVRYA